MSKVGPRAVRINMRVDNTDLSSAPAMSVNGFQAGDIFDNNNPTTAPLSLAYNPPRIIFVCNAINLSRPL